MLNLSCFEIVYSVLITFGSFTLYFIVIGIQQSFGIIYTSLLDYFKESKSDTAWISSLANGVLFMFGPVAGVIGKRYGNHFTAMLGSILSTSGLISSCFVRSIYLLYLTHGIVTGIGFCLMFNATNSVINLAFDKRRALATGIATSGIGFGTIVLPLLASHLLNIYGWRGTFLIFGGIALQGLCAGMIFRLHRRKLKNEKTFGGGVSNIQPETKKDTIYKLTKELLCSTQLRLMISSASLAMSVYFVPYLMLPDMVKDLGMSGDSGALMITVSGIFNIASRIIFGHISTLPSVNRLVLNGVSLVIVGVATSSCFVIETEYLFYIYTSVLGVTIGIFGMLQPVLLVDITGKTNVEFAFGILSFFIGIATVGGPPLAGFITDSTGNYRMAFLCSGGVFMVAGILSFLASYYNKCTRSK